MRMRIHRDYRCVLRDDGRALDAATGRWLSAAAEAPDAEPATAEEALAFLQSGSPPLIRAPVAVVGPSHATPEQIEDSRCLGRLLAGLGLAIVTGGLGGVMASAAEGAVTAGGLAVGVLPGADARAGNRWQTLSLATNLGEARNAVLANCCVAMVAVGSSHGTLSEIALALRIGKPVFGLPGTPMIDGLILCDTPSDAVRSVARRLLGLD